MSTNSANIVLKCIFTHAPITSEHILDRQTGTRELIYHPHAATRGLEMPNLATSIEACLNLGKFHRIDLGDFVVEESHVTGIAQYAPNPKDFKATFRNSEFHENIITALASLYNNLEVLDLRRCFCAIC
jgi:hypothetical protein